MQSELSLDSGSTGAPTSRAILRFLGGWREIEEGELRPGGNLVIEYDPERLPHCHTTWRGADIWNISAYIRFHPGGQFYERSILKTVSYQRQYTPVELTVPSDATEVELWFYTSYQLSSFCEAWDSRFGQNYWFAVAPT